MAPLPPSKRRSLRARATSSTTTTTTTTPTPTPTHSLVSTLPASSKKARRVAKRHALVSRIHKTAAASSRSSISSRHRRRPNNKLSANLSSLLDALPSLDDDGDNSNGNDSNNNDNNGNSSAQDLQTRITNKILKHKSVKSKPGALKKKEKIARWEMKEFGKNLVALQRVQEDKSTTTTTALSSSLSLSVTGQVQSSSPQPDQDIASAPTTNRWAQLRKHISSSMDHTSI